MSGSFFATCLAGCGDPATDRLEVGQRVMLVPHHLDADGKPSATAVLDGVPGKEILLVPAGTEARVARDDGAATDAVRKVLVTIAEGEHAGVVAEESRFCLRPLR